MEALGTPRLAPRTENWELPAVSAYDQHFDLTLEASDKLPKPLMTPPRSPRGRGATSPRQPIVEDSYQQHSRLMVALGGHLESVGSALRAYAVAESDARSGIKACQQGRVQALRSALAAMISNHRDSLILRPPPIEPRDSRHALKPALSRRLATSDGLDRTASTFSMKKAVTIEEDSLVRAPQSAIGRGMSSVWSGQSAESAGDGSLTMREGRPFSMYGSQGSDPINLALARTSCQPDQIQAYSSNLRLTQSCQFPHWVRLSAAEASSSAESRWKEYRRSSIRESLRRQETTPTPEAIDNKVEHANHVGNGVEMLNLRQVTKTVDVAERSTEIEPNDIEEMDNQSTILSAQSSIMFERQRSLVNRMTAYVFGDSCVALVILAYAVVLGISADTEWDGWQRVEYGFTGFFVFELLLKLFGLGPYQFFVGPDRSWNIFDSVIVAIALLDSTLSILWLNESDTDFSNLYIVRVVRLCRLARLIRLLRFNMFSELRTMISGIVSGLRVLVWAVVLFFVMLYVTAIVLRQLLGPGFSESPAESDPELLKAFANMPASINSLFMCFTGDCTASDGSPLQVRMYDRQGFTFIVSCMLVMLFVNIGLFNLIMATFVDNVLEKGRQQKLEKRAQMSKMLERRLRSVVKSYVRRGACTTTFHSGKTSTFEVKAMKQRCWYVIGWLKELIGYCPLHPVDQSKPDESISNFSITRGGFRELLAEPKMEETLVLLDIETSSQDDLFDVLDADMSGELDFEELIMGLMSLRGPAEKKDIIGSLLCIRATQQYLREGQEQIDSHMDRVFTDLKVYTDQVLALIENVMSRLENPA